MPLAGHQTLGNIGVLYLRTGPSNTIEVTAGEVTRWADSGSVVDAAPQSSGTRPTAASNALGDGSGQGVLFASGDNLESTYDPPTNCTMWVVLRRTATSASYGHVFGGAADDWEVYVDVNTGNLRLYDGTNDWDLQTALVVNTVHRLVFKRTAGAYTFYNNSTTASRTWTGATNLPINFAWLSSNGEGSDSNLYPLINATMVAGGVIERDINATDLGTLLSLMADEATGVRFVTSLTESVSVATDSATADHGSGTANGALTEVVSAATDSTSADADIASAITESVAAASDGATVTAIASAAVTESTSAATDASTVAHVGSVTIAESTSAATDSAVATSDIGVTLAEPVSAATDEAAATLVLVAGIAESVSAAADASAVGIEGVASIAEVVSHAADEATIATPLAVAIGETVSLAVDAGNVAPEGVATATVAEVVSAASDAAAVGSALSAAIVEQVSAASDAARLGEEDVGHPAIRITARQPTASIRVAAAPGPSIHIVARRPSASIRVRAAA